MARLRLIEPMSRGYFPGPDDPPRPPQFSPRPFRVTVQRYHAMIAGGAFVDEPHVELIDGELIERCGSSAPHEGCSEILAGELRDRASPEWAVRQRRPLTLREIDSEPEPDVVVLCGSKRDWSRRHPVASEVHLTVEVADLSLNFDRTRKARIYAAAGLSPYWIVNLPDRVLEVRTDPHVAADGSAEYRTLRTLGEADTLTFTLADREFTLAVADLLPAEGTESVPDA